MKIIAIEKNIPGIEKEKFTSELLKEEAKKVWEYYESGIFREMYFAKETHKAVIILECLTESDATGYLQELPLVKYKLIEFETYSLINYDGFKRLFI